jgi:pilus assembly protein Flp/PilA
MLKLFRSFWTDESGQTLAEYALLLGLIAIVVILVLIALGEEINEVFSRITNEFSTNVPG